MSLLSDDDLAFMRQTQNEAMPDTVYILRMGTVGNGMGGYTESWGTIGTVTGRVYPIRRTERNENMAGGQIISLTDWYFTAPVGTDVTANDRVEYNNRSWEVYRVNNDEMWQTAVRCELISHNEEKRV